MIWFFRFLLLGLAAMGVTLVVQGIRMRRVRSSATTHWTPTTGVVVDVLRRVDADMDDVNRRGPLYFHLVRYPDPSGVEHEVWTERWLRHELPRGSRLPVRFDPADPSHVTTLAPDDNTGAVGAAVFLAAGAFFLLIGGYGAALTLS